MRYLKRFNEELKGSTFRSAATKLKQLGHIRRSQEIEQRTKWLKEQAPFQFSSLIKYLSKQDIIPSLFHSFLPHLILPSRASIRSFLNLIASLLLAKIKISLSLLSQ